MNKALLTHRSWPTCAARAGAGPLALAARTRRHRVAMLADNPLAALIFGDFAYLKKPV